VHWRTDRNCKLPAVYDCDGMAQTVSIIGGLEDFRLSRPQVGVIPAYQNVNFTRSRSVWAALRKMLGRGLTKALLSPCRAQESRH